jgi:hypothetical protein
VDVHERGSGHKTYSFIWPRRQEASVTGCRTIDAAIRVALRRKGLARPVFKAALQYPGKRSSAEVKRAHHRYEQRARVESLRKTALAMQSLASAG